VPTVDLEEPLRGEVDREALRSEIPPSFTVKGLFCADLATALGADYGALVPKLAQAPRGGRYLAFTDYPMRDHLVLAHALGDKRFPKTGTPQAQRLLARHDVKTLGRSTLGRIMLAMAREPEGALLRLPEVFHRMTFGPKVEASVDGRDVRLEFTDNYGGWEYNFGQVEGIVMHYGGRPRIEIELYDRGRQVFVVRGA
jgi:uncharacterized protein (TIGR02265 family)